MLPGSGLDGGHLAAARSRSAGRIRHPAIASVMVWPCGSYLCGCTSRRAPYRLRNSASLLPMRAPAKRVQLRGALELDAHHAVVDDHEIEVRSAALVTQVPALARGLAPSQARPVGQRQYLRRRVMPVRTGPSAPRPRHQLAAAEAMPAAAKPIADRAAAAMPAPRLTRAPRRSCLTTTAARRDAADRGCRDSGPGRAASRGHILRTPRAVASCAGSRPRSSASVRVRAARNSASTRAASAARSRAASPAPRCRSTAASAWTSSRVRGSALVAVDLDVAHVADLLDRGEGLARHAFPR